jgi:hypothetical protein
VDLFSQQGGQRERLWREDHKLFAAQKEPVAQLYGAQVGSPGKRKVVEPDGLLTAYELAERVCRVFGCPHYEHLSIAENAA